MHSVLYVIHCPILFSVNVIIRKFKKEKNLKCENLYIANKSTQPKTFKNMRVKNILKKKWLVCFPIQGAIEKSIYLIFKFTAPILTSSLNVSETTLKACDSTHSKDFINEMHFLCFPELAWEGDISILMLSCMLTESTYLGCAAGKYVWEINRYLSFSFLPLPFSASGYMCSIRWGMGQSELCWLSGRWLLTRHFQVQRLCLNDAQGGREPLGLQELCGPAQWTIIWALDNWHSKSCLEQPNWWKAARVGTNPRIGMQSSPKRPCLQFLKVSKMGTDQEGLNISLSLTKL